jgi:hypothetical protein
MQIKLETPFTSWLYHIVDLFDSIYTISAYNAQFSLALVQPIHIIYHPFCGSTANSDLDQEITGGNIDLSLSI